MLRSRQQWNCVLNIRLGLLSVDTTATDEVCQAIAGEMRRQFPDVPLLTSDKTASVYHKYYTTITHTHTTNNTHFAHALLIRRTLPPLLKKRHRDAKSRARGILGMAKPRTKSAANAVFDPED